MHLYLHYLQAFQINASMTNELRSSIINNVKNIVHVASLDTIHVILAILIIPYNDTVCTEWFMALNCLRVAA